MRLGGAFLAVAALAAPTWATDLLIGERGLTSARAEKAVRGLGQLKGKNADGFYQVSLKAGTDPAKASKTLKARGIDYVHRSEAVGIRRTNLNSVSRHVAYLESKYMMNLRPGEKPDGERGVDFYRALEEYLRGRVDENGELNHDAYRKAAEHRDKMPEAKPEWFGNGSATENPSGYFSYVGPKKLDIPYRRYYGQPTLSGRKNDGAYARSNVNTVYVASAGGGIWKSTDAGNTWAPKSENWKFMHSSCVAVHPNNADIVIAGTGDYQGFFTAQTFGVMRSTDGGTTWTNYGAADFGDKIVSEIMYCPEDPNIVIATIGGSGGDIWRSTNGGVTWTATNAVGGDWSDLDIADDPMPATGNRRMWAAGGGTTKIAYSDDRGATWTAVTKPAGMSVSESVVDIAASTFDPDGVYIVGPNNNKVYKSSNGGSTWTDISAGIPTGASVRPNYNWEQDTYDIYIQCLKNGSGADVIVLGLITISVSDDGGATWTDSSRSFESDSKWHNDQHNFVPHPTLNNFGLALGDGGVNSMVWNPTTNVGTFTSLNDTFYDTQFYWMSLHPASYSTYMMGGTQDLASPASRGNLAQWDNLFAGDGFGSGFDGTNPGKHYTTAQFGDVYRYDSSLDTSATDISPGGGPFATPLLVSGPGRSTVYTVRSSRVIRNAGGTSGWTNSTTLLPGTPRTLSGSPHSSTRIFSGDGSGNLYMSTDSGVNFSQRDGTTLPALSIGDIEESPFTQYWVIAGMRSTSSTQGGVWRTTNINTATPVWTRISGTGATALPAMPVNAVARDPWQSNTYYAGTDVGMFVSPDAGVTWYTMKSLGLPNVHVNDIWISGDKNYMYVATFGRGIWRIGLKNVRLSRIEPQFTAVYGGQSFWLNIFLDAPAIGGVRVSLVDNSSVTTTPSSVAMNAGFVNGFATISSTAVTSTVGVTFTASYNGSTATTQVSIHPVPNITSLTFNPNPVYGSKSTTGRVQLSVAAPIATTIRLSETSSFLTLPLTSFTMPAGASVGFFTVNTSTVTTDTPGQAVRAYVFPDTADVIQGTVDLLRLPSVDSLSVSPTSVTGGTSVTATVRLDRVAPPGGQVVITTDNSTVATTPPSVTVPAGSNQVSYSIATTLPRAATVVTAYARIGTVTKSTTFTVTR